MKKPFLFTLILLINTLHFVIAQTEKNTILIGISSNFGAGGTESSLVFSSSKFKSDDFESDSFKSTGFNLSSRVGTFLANDFVFGLDLGFNTASSNEGETKSSQIIAGPFARYYFKSSRIKPFIEANVNLGASKNTFSFATINGFDNNNTSKSSITSYGGGAGAAFFLGSKVSFDAMLGYSHASSKRKEDNPDNSRLIINAISLRLGFSIYLGGSQRQDLAE